MLVRKKEKMRRKTWGLKHSVCNDNFKEYELSINSLIYSRAVYETRTSGFFKNVLQQLHSLIKPRELPQKPNSEKP